MVNLAFDYMVTGPFYGIPDSGTVPLIGSLMALILILCVVLKLIFDKHSPVIYYCVILVVAFGGGRMYREVMKNEEVSVHASNVVRPLFFKTLAPLIIYVIPYRLQSVKVLNTNQLIQVTGVGCILYILYLGTIFLVIYCEYALCFNWHERSLAVLSFAVSIFQPELAIEKLESKGGHVKYLQALLKTEIIFEVFMSYTIVDTIMKSDYHPVVEEASISTVAYTLTLQFCGAIIGLVGGIISHVLSSYAFGDPLVSPTVVVAFCFFVYSVAELANLSGCSAVLVYSVMTTIAYRPKMLVEHETFARNLWNLIYFFAVSYMIALTGFLLASVDRELDIRHFCFAFGIFAVSLMARLLYCFLLLPYLYGGNPKWTELAMTVIGPYRGVSSVLLGLYYATSDTDESLQIVAAIIVVVMMSLFLNVILLEWFIERLDIFHLTKAQLSNMNAAVEHINKCRANMIFAEKLDRFIADANWPVVAKITSFAHPYKDRLRKNEFADVFKDEVKTVQCPRCGDWTIAPPTRKEIDEITRETKLRVLKAQQVSFQKQRESGTLTINGYKFLSNLVYQSSFSDDLTVNTDDLRILADDLKYVKKCQNYFITIKFLTLEQYDWQPTNKIRLRCFNIATSQSFRITMAITSLIDMFLSLSFAYLYASTGRKDDNTNTKIWPIGTYIMGWCVAVVTPCLYLLNIVEAMIQIIGLGLMQYFSKRVYKVEFLSCIIMRTLQLVLFISECTYAGNYLNFTDASSPVVLMSCLMILRVTRFYIFFVSLIPCILSRIKNTIDTDLLKRYDIGKAYLVSLDRVLKYLSQLTANQQVLEEVKKIVETDRQKVTKELGVIQKEHPNIAITVKTKHAIRHVINSMEECANGMQNEGILDNIEHGALSRSLHKVRMKVFKLTFIEPPLPINIMKEILWLQGDDEHTELFLNEAVMYNYDYNDALIRNGEDPLGLYILVSGLLKAAYVPSPTSITLASKFGVLPNYDFFENFKFDQPQEEFIVSGNVVGELGLVTGRRYDMTVIADTAAQVYFIPDNVMKSLHSTYSGQQLLAKIWKKVAVKISVTLLQFTNAYRHWTIERLYGYLHKGVIPNLTGVEAVNLDAKVEEAILIEGVAMDVSNHNIIYGPYHIPNNVDKLLLPEHRDWDFQTVYETKLFLVLAPGALVTDLLEVARARQPLVVEDREEGGPTLEEKPKKKIDKSRKVGFTDGPESSDTERGKKADAGGEIEDELAEL